MKHTQTLLVAAISAPALLAFALPREAIRFAPSEGAAVKKSFETITRLTMDDMSMTMNGSDMGMAPEMEMDVVSTSTVTVNDVFVAVADGVPAKLKRTYESIGTDINVEMSIDMMGETQENDSSGTGSSELEGETVLFAWDADAEEHDVTFADEEGDEELLVGLVEDMDMRGLLPEDEVSEGDEWDIPLTVLPDILAPGGDMHLDIEMDGMEGAGMAGGGMDPTMMSNMREMFGDLLEGEATGTFSGTREVDGVRVAVIDFTIDISTARDMSDMMEEMMGENLPVEVDMSVERVDIEFTMTGSGTLLWNLKGGHLHSFELTGETTIAMDMEVGLDMSGQSMSMETSMEMSGTVEQTVKTE